MIIRYVAPAFFLLLFFVKTGDSQLVTMFSMENKTNDCRIWSPWGQCIWLQTVSSRNRRTKTYSYKPYLDQLTRGCRNHWIYKWIRSRYYTAMNNAFSYLSQVTQDKEPCGMCSYRQSCGQGAPKYCNLEPTRARRNSMYPFYVTEEVCGTGKGLRRSQRHACTARATSLMNNDKVHTSTRDKLRSCILWPSDRVRLPGLPKYAKNTITNLKWSNCVFYFNRRIRTSECKCCCFPYTPKKRGSTFICVHIEGAPQAPGAIFR